MEDKQYLKYAVPILLIVGVAIFLTTTTGPTAFSISQDEQQETQLNTLLALTDCTLDGYDNCLQDAYTDGDARAFARLGYDSFNNPSATDSWDYTCEGDKAVFIQEGDLLAGEMIEDYDTLTFKRGEEVSLTGSIDFTEMENGYTLICAVKDEANGDIASGFIWVEDTSVDVQEEEEEEPAAPTEASVTVDNTKATTDSSIQFDASGSSGEGTLGYYWYLEETGESLGTGETLSFSPDSPGSYTVVLDVTSESGETDTVRKTVEFVEPVKAVVSVSETSVQVGDTVTYSASQSEGSNLSYEWYFESSPSDTVSDSESFDYTFTETGTKTMVVEVTDSLGNTESNSISVDVSPEDDDDSDPDDGDDGTGFFQGIINFFTGFF